MAEITKSLLIEAIVSALPYPQQIQDFDLTGEEDAIRFTWRSGRYRCSLSLLSVEQVQGSCLAGTDIAIVMEELIKASMQKKLNALSKAKVSGC